jgi:hypothetical protein
MNRLAQRSEQSISKVDRPWRGTESPRNAALIGAATHTDRPT